MPSMTHWSMVGLGYLNHIGSSYSGRFYMVTLLGNLEAASPSLSTSSTSPSNVFSLAGEVRQILVGLGGGRRGRGRSGLGSDSSSRRCSGSRSLGGGGSLRNNCGSGGCDSGGSRVDGGDWSERSSRSNRSCAGGNTTESSTTGGNTTGRGNTSSGLAVSLALGGRHAPQLGALHGGPGLSNLPLERA